MELYERIFPVAVSALLQFNDSNGGTDSDDSDGSPGLEERVCRVK